MPPPTDPQPKPLGQHPSLVLLGEGEVGGRMKEGGRRKRCSQPEELSLVPPPLGTVVKCPQILVSSCPVTGSCPE